MDPRMLPQTSGLLHTQRWSLYFPSLAWFFPGTLLYLLLSSSFSPLLSVVFHSLKEVAIWWAGQSPTLPHHHQRVPRGWYRTSLCYSG